MNDYQWVPVFRGPFEDASLLKAFLESDGLAVKLIPDVTSEPLQSPGAHNIRSQYTEHVVLVTEDEKKRAEELLDSFLSED
jgi:hypothetical protein